MKNEIKLNSKKKKPEQQNMKISQLNSEHKQQIRGAIKGHKSMKKQKKFVYNLKFDTYYNNIIQKYTQ